jgi:hypothetical protein
MSDILETGPADSIPSWDTLATRHDGAVRRFESIAKKAEVPTKHVGAAIRDGLVFEAASHACAALVGVGLWPLVEHAAHVVLGWVAS